MLDMLSKKADKGGWFSGGERGGNDSEHPSAISLEVARLWQLDHNYHCAIIGTCLTIAEVKKLLKQLRIGTHGYSAYELHSTIVTIIADNAFPSKKVQNFLDKKFKLIVQQVKKMSAEELMGFWRAALYSGDMIGAFWAVMMHPNSDAGMKKNCYGDIHMLSHMSGASNRADLKRLSQLENERHEIKGAVRAQNLKYNKLALENNRLQQSVVDYKEQNTGLKNEINALNNSLEQVMILQSTKSRQELEAQVIKLNNKVACQVSEIGKLQRSSHQLSEIVSRQKRKICADKNEWLECKNEVVYLQSRLEQTVRSCPLQKQNLCGQCVLYVGGKTNLVPFYRNLVEEKSGIFMHHDGGMEKNTQDLQQSLGKADIVIFPSDCISHDAYWKIKAICKKQHKPFRYLKSSGLYALSSMLDMISVKTTAINV
ncbi:MAG: hypothetical protein methR_P0867 [Methyloprofundus sp.]|nr:MAG: hypothetical protein methR_P0867 [Methyloprofundus sp.]